MSTPMVGQPFIAGHAEFSLGDPAAMAGSVAYESVLIGPVPVGVDVPPPIVVSLADTPNFTLTTQLRLAALPGDYAFLNPTILHSATVEHHIQNVDVGGAPTVVAGGTITVAGSSPSGASAAFSGGLLHWYNATSNPITLAEGTYRILTHVHCNSPFASALAAFHDGTYIMVVP